MSFRYEELRKERDSLLTAHAHLSAYGTRVRMEGRQYLNTESFPPRYARPLQAATEELYEETRRLRGLIRDELLAVTRELNTLTPKRRDDDEDELVELGPGRPSKAG